MSAASAPLSCAQVDALLQPLETARCILVAISGGPDSTALLLMAAAWAARRKTIQVAAATVDHGLRVESGQEAAMVSALCARLNVPHAILQWRGVKLSTRVQERAREARYGLLAEHARAIGADAIATAHHADDQAETVLFRLVRGSGIAGLRGMEAVSRREGILHFRPLLSVPKADLIAFCEAQDTPYASDPSNDNPRYARTRLRQLLAQLQKEGLDREGFLRLARRAAEADDAIAAAADDLERRLGLETVDAAVLFSAPVAVAQRVLARRIAAAGGRGESRLGLEKIERLAALLREARTSGKGHAANIGGVLIRLTPGGHLQFAPEPLRRQPKENES